MSVLTITLGETTQLQVKVPSKGETDWSESFKTEFAQKIVVHDHTGVDGKGAKISTAALEDGAVTTVKLEDDAVTTDKIATSVVTSKLNLISIDALSDVNTTSSAPSAGQVLKWSGSEWGPGTDASAAGSGTVVIATQTDATAYSPTAGDVIAITATSDISFSQELSNVIILQGDTYNKITFNNNVSYSIIQTKGDIDVINLNTDGTDISVTRCNIGCQGLKLENTAGGSNTYLSSSRVTSLDLEAYPIADGDVRISYSEISCAQQADLGIYGASRSVDVSRSSISTNKIKGNIATHDFNGCLINVFRGTGSGGTDLLKVVDGSGNTLINGNYDHPFTVRHKDIESRIVAKANAYSSSGAQSFDNTSGDQTIIYPTKDFDSTNSYSTTTGKFTAPIQGYYKVKLQADFYFAGTGSISLKIKVGSTEKAKTISREGNSSEATSTRYMDINALLFLEVGDEVSVTVSGGDAGYDVGGPTASGTDAYLEIEKIN